jgi:hypothetical protein
MAVSDAGTVSGSDSRSREVYPIFGKLCSLIERNDWCTLSASSVSYAD